MKLDTIPIDVTGKPLARGSEKSDSAPRDLRSLLLQALANAPIAGWMQVAPGMQRPQPDDPKTLLERVRLIDRIEASNGEIDLGGDELTLVEKCVASEFTIGAVMIMRAMHKKEDDNG
jgi:hypothetical protein